MKLFVVIFSLMIFAECPSFAQSPPASEMEIKDVRFGIFHRKGDQVIGFTETTVVPLVEGVSYGWKIRLKTDKRQIQIKEELVLPEPAQWESVSDGSGKLTVSKDKKTGVAEYRLTVKEGEAFHTWEVLASDPSGKYINRLYVEDKLIKIFQFTLDPKASQPKPDEILPEKTVP